jgi:hypothetical protein
MAVEGVGNSQYEDAQHSSEELRLDRHNAFQHQGHRCADYPSASA